MITIRTRRVSPEWKATGAAASGLRKQMIGRGPACCWSSEPFASANNPQRSFALQIDYKHDADTDTAQKPGDPFSTTCCARNEQILTTEIALDGKPYVISSQQAFRQFTRR